MIGVEILGLGLSIAMCTFNGKEFLPWQLKSIADQDRPPDELVICDDGSSDGCIDILDGFARTAAFPVRVIRNEKTLGSTRNFNQAISLCTGDIVTLADQDDFWYPHKLARIESEFRTRSAAVAVFSDADLIDDSGALLRLSLWESFSFGVRDQKRFANGEALHILLKHPVVTGATMAFQRRFVPLISPIPPNHVHDNWTSFLLAACGPFIPITESLMRYRCHGNQQIGPGLVTFRERIAQALNTGPHFYMQEIVRFRQLYERLEQRRADFPFAECALREIRAKICHREHRALLPRTSVSRIPRVIREVLNGGYWRYSEGWESVAKDMAGVFDKRNPE